MVKRYGCEKCEYFWFFFLNEKLKSCNAFLKIQMLYHMVPKHLEHQFMFKAVSCWVGHLGCKLDTTFLHFEKRRILWFQNKIPPLSTSLSFLRIACRIRMTNYFKRRYLLVCFSERGQKPLFQWILLRRDTLFIVGGGSQFQKRFI